MLAGQISAVWRMALSLATCATHSAPQQTQVAFAQTRSITVDEEYEQEIERADQSGRSRVSAFQPMPAVLRHLAP